MEERKSVRVVGRFSTVIFIRRMDFLFPHDEEEEEAKTERDEQSAMIADHSGRDDQVVTNGEGWARVGGGLA